MNFTQIACVLPGDEADRLSDALTQAGALSVEITDADAGTQAEQAAFDEPEQVHASWRRCRVSALFAQGADARGVLARACARVGVALPEAIEETEVADQDWVRLTRDQFRPIRIASRLWIVPSWESAPDPQAINLRLDPGLAFGTGSHPTTRLCLQWLEANLAPGTRVLDYGCGSGILAIAAERLGAAVVVGVDIDPQALVAARANAMQNGVAARFHEPGAEPNAGYHVVLANILANPLIALAPLLRVRTLPRCHVVLSGILEDQAEDVARAYRPWFAMSEPRIDDGWALLVGERREEAGA